MEGDGIAFAPRSRMVWSVVIGAVLAIAGAFSPIGSSLFLICFFLFLLAVIADLVFLLKGGPYLELDPSEQQVSLHRGKEGYLKFKYRTVESKGGEAESIGFRLPEGFRFRSVYLSLNTGDDEEPVWREKSVSLVGMKRGRFKLEELFSQDRSKLGLWQSRRALKVSWTMSVFPHLKGEERAVSSFLMRRDLAGSSARRILGKGREFDRLRSYQPGDAYADICWKASARRRAPITKVMQVERTQQVYALLDCSRLSQRVVDTIKVSAAAREGDVFDTTLEREEWPLEALDRYINGALSLALATESQGDRFGMIGFSSHPRLFMKAGYGNGHYLAVRESLLGLKADAGNPDYFELFSQVRTKIRSRSLLVVFTHFDDPGLVESFLEASKLVARQHLVVAVSILSGETKALFSEENITDYPELYERLTGHVVWRNIQNIGKQMAPYGIKMLTTHQGSMCSQVISRYLQIKERQLV